MQLGSSWSGGGADALPRRCYTSAYVTPVFTFLAMASASSLFSVALSYAFPTSATKSFTVPHRNLRGGGGRRKTTFYTAPPTQLGCY